MSIVALDLYFHENLVSIQYSQWLNDVPWYLREKLYQTPQRDMKKYWSTRKPWMKKKQQPYGRLVHWIFMPVVFFAFYNIAGFKCLPVDFRGPKYPQSYNCTFSYFPSATYRLPLKLNIRVVFVCWRIRSSGWTIQYFPGDQTFQALNIYWSTTKRPNGSPPNVHTSCIVTAPKRKEFRLLLRSKVTRVLNTMWRTQSWPSNHWTEWILVGINFLKIARVKCSSAQSTRKKNIAAWKCSVLKHFSKPKFEQPSTPGHSTGLVQNVCTIVCNCLQ